MYKIFFMIFWCFNLLPELYAITDPKSLENGVMSPPSKPLSLFSPKDSLEGFSLAQQQGARPFLSGFATHESEDQTILFLTNLKETKTSEEAVFHACLAHLLSIVFKDSTVTDEKNILSVRKRQ